MNHTVPITMTAELSSSAVKFLMRPDVIGTLDTTISISYSSQLIEHNAMKNVAELLKTVVKITGANLNLMKLEPLTLNQLVM